MRELSLFSGAGGGLLASKHLLGWRTIGYVEYNDFCQRVIAQRIKDGLLDNAPIFGDIRTFLSEGYAASYTGLVDVVSGGFPCQPFSLAGGRLGVDDPRNMWPSTLQVLRIIKPHFAFLENVPGLLTSGYFGTILGDLADYGFDVRWGLLSACSFDAPHTRQRLWIMAYANGGGLATDMLEASRADRNGTSPIGSVEGWMRQSSGFGGGAMANRSKSNTETSPWIDAASESPLVGMADGVAHRVERLRAIGNGQVPIVAATAWRILSGER